MRSFRVLSSLSSLSRVSGCRLSSLGRSSLSSLSTLSSLSPLSSLPYLQSRSISTSSSRFRTTSFNHKSNSPLITSLYQCRHMSQASQTPTSSSSNKTATLTVSDASSDLSQEASSLDLGRRLKLSLEITVSKLFPAGFGWQGFSVIAANNGLAPTSLGFAVMTGVGDSLGVGLGHLTYKLIQRSIAQMVNIGKKEEDKWVVPVMGTETQTALFLSTATFFSGTMWQPAVNLTTMFNAGFWPIFAGTGALCGCAFFFGLRLGRQLYGRLLGLSAIAPPTYDNVKADAYLSIGIGGAAAVFVGTDFAMLDNPFRSIFGVLPTDSTLVGCVRAGASTAAGYFTLQMVQNVSMPSGKNWLDANFKA